MGWDWDQLVLFLLHSISQRIASFLLMKEEVGDNLIWTVGKLGIVEFQEYTTTIHPPLVVVYSWNSTSGIRAGSLSKG